MANQEYLHTNGEQQLLVLDIETVLDTSVMKYLESGHNNLPNESIKEWEKLITEEADDKQLRDALRGYHLDITDGRNSFPRQLFHAVSELSYVCGMECNRVKDDDGRLIEVDKFVKVQKIVSLTANLTSNNGNNNQHNEKESKNGVTVNNNILLEREKLILGDFCRRTKGKKPKIVTFNGRTFDIPVIKYRAMKHAISIPLLFDKRYSYRYDLNGHLDLLEAFSDYKASASIRMKEICALFGIPCKYGNDGSDVEEMFCNGQFKDISNYCELDVIITFILYLRYKLVSGQMSINGYNRSVKSLEEYANSVDGESGNEDCGTDEKATHKQHIVNFISRWQDCGTMYISSLV